MNSRIDTSSELPSHTLTVRQELEKIIESVKIISDRSYVINGRCYDLPKPYGVTKNNSNRRTGVMTEQEVDLEISSDVCKYLGEILYQNYHCRTDTLNNDLGDNLDFIDNRDFLDLLSQANTGKGSWDPGWQIIRIEKNRQLVVHKDGLTLWIHPWQFASYDREIKMGKKGYIPMVREYRLLLPGFYMANSDAPLDDPAVPPIVRIYWNIHARGSVRLLQSITLRLNANRVPFKFKILSNPSLFKRADSAVLYVCKKYLPGLREILSKIYQASKQYMKDETPLFAKRLAPGISLAEDPDNGESFGQNRCRILAEAICTIAVARKMAEREYGSDFSTHSICIKEIDGIESYFNKFGIDIDRPYLKSKSSIDDYDTILAGAFC
jgi:hypothetical protein